MAHTKEQFIDFCIAFEEVNGFEVKKEEIKLQENEGTFTYDATFRDDANYKENVVLTLKDGKILIAGYDEPGVPAGFFVDSYFHWICSEAWSTFEKVNLV